MITASGPPWSPTSVVLVAVSHRLGLGGRLGLPLHVSGGSQAEGEEEEGAHGAGRRRDVFPPPVRR